MAKVSVSKLDQSVTGGFTPASPGVYDAVIVAAIDSVDEFEGNKKDVTKLIFQITEDDKVHLVRSAGFVPSFHEKSGFYKFLSEWLKTKDATAIKAALEKAKIIENGELDFDKFVGKRCGLLIGNKTSKAGKDYAVIASYMPLKNKDTKAVPGKIPSFYLEDAKSYKLLDGMTCEVQPEAIDTKAPDINVDDFIDSMD